MLNNPELTSRLLNNPLVQDLMSNPDTIRMMMNANPQMQQLIERNPEINHLLNNNEILRSSLEMMRNPSAFQELMRTQDRALSNLESLPGGYNALRRMYTELQEPMLNAASEQFTGENPFANFARQNNNTNVSSTNVQAGTENRDPLPNPWGPPATSTAGSNTQTSNPLGGGRAGQAGANPFGGLFENRELMNSILNSPQTQQLMQQMTSNPELMQRMMADNPLLSSDPAVQRQMSQLIPNAFQQLQSPEMREAISNPAAMNAMLQITQGFETLQRVAPSLFQAMTGGSGIGMTAGFPFGTSDANQSSTPTNTSSTTTNTSSTTNTTSSTGNTTTNANQPNISQLNQMLNQMLSVGLDNANPANPPAQSLSERYRDQLEQLTAMGFTNREENLNALAECFGDVNRAIEKLLNNGQSYFS